MATDLKKLRVGDEVLVVRSALRHDVPSTAQKTTIWKIGPKYIRVHGSDEKFDRETLSEKTDGTPWKRLSTPEREALRERAATAEQNLRKFGIAAAFGRSWMCDLGKLFAVHNALASLMGVEPLSPDE